VPELLTTADLLACGGVDCQPPVEVEPAPVTRRERQPIDYLAKDYDSFLRGLLDLVSTRLPASGELSESEFARALLEVLAYAGDMLSYQQDRVALEGFLRTATRYDSVRRLLSLIDYPMDPGNAAEVIVALTPTAATLVPAGYRFWAPESADMSSVIFEAAETRIVYPELTGMTLASDAPEGPRGTELVLNAERHGGFLPVGARLHLESGESGEWVEVASPVLVNPVTHTTRVECTVPLAGSYPAATSRVIGNGVRATHGETQSELRAGSGTPEQEYQLAFGPLTYTRDRSGRPLSSLRVEVEEEPWLEVEDFVASEPTDAHYRVERDERGFATVHFGDGTRGRIPPAPLPGASFDVARNIRFTYRTGIGEAGLVARGALTEFRDAGGIITAVTNPEPSSGALDPETIEAAKLAGPRILLQQNRAVVPEDYTRLVRQGVILQGQLIRPLEARARFLHSGSWTTVVVSVDLPGHAPLGSFPGLRDGFESLLSDRKLAGYDVAVEDARYAPVHLRLLVRVDPGHFARQVRRAVLRTLSGPATRGRPFFSAGRFSFGQPLFLSDLYGVVMAVPGVEAVEVTRFKRLGDRFEDRESAGVIRVGALEILRLDNDPSRPENGLLSVRTCGGKEG
jgi:hypothetical protein